MNQFYRPLTGKTMATVTFTLLMVLLYTGGAGVAVADTTADSSVKKAAESDIKAEVKKETAKKVDTKAEVKKEAAKKTTETTAAQKLELPKTLPTQAPVEEKSFSQQMNHFLDKHKSKWWFWAAVGGTVVVTGVIIGVAASGDDAASAPTTGTVDLTFHHAIRGR